MNESVEGKTFWSVISACCFVGIAIATVVYGSLTRHVEKGYHEGMPLYVEQRIQDNTKELASEIRQLRREIQALRESLIASGQLTPR